MESAVRSMSEDLCCDEGIAGIAAAAHYSKFHFTREFNRLVGTTPRRYLAALRMSRAKDLLLHTNLGVVDVSTLVGYVSVGTFSSRFSSLVGLSPTEWRHRGGSVEPLDTEVGHGERQVHGLIDRSEVAGETFIAAYEDSVIQGRPVACTRLSENQARFQLKGLPVGTWHICAVVTSESGQVLGRAGKSVEVETDQRNGVVVGNLLAHSQTSLDPPVVFAAATRPVNPYDSGLDRYLDSVGVPASAIRRAG